MITGQQIHDIVRERKHDILQCLSEAIQIPSEQTYKIDDSTDGRCGSVFTKWLRSFGFEPMVLGVNENRLNVLCDWKGRQAGPTFLFNGHLDTHPRPPVEGEHGNFSGDITDEFVFGVGASNMKSGDTCALFAMGLLKKLGFDPKGTITYSLVVDEQNGGVKGARWLMAHGYLKSDFGISMDVSDKKLGVEIGALGKYFITYRSAPAPAHRPHPSTDAMLKSMRAVNELLKYREAFIKPIPGCNLKQNMSLTTFHGGHAANTYADKCTFSIDCRIAPPRTPETVRQDFVAILEKLKMDDSEMDYELYMPIPKPAMLVPEDSRIVKACDEASVDMFGKPLERSRHMGGQDAERIHEKWGTIMPILSPSMFESIAQPDEHVSVEDMLTTTELYMRILVKMMG